MPVNAKDLPLHIQKMLGLKKEHKYRAAKREVDGIKFDSGKEAKYYMELVLRQRVKEIRGFVLKPTVVLQEKFTAADGSKIRAIEIIPDFLVWHLDGSSEYVDVKGMATPDWKLKWKLLKYKYRDDAYTKFTVV